MNFGAKYYSWCGDVEESLSPFAITFNDPAQEVLLG